MGFIAIVLSFTHVSRNGLTVSDVKVDPGGGANVTAEHFSASGDDAQPLPGDYAVAIDVESSGRRLAAAGYIDSTNTPTAGPGEKRIYGRGASGAAVNQVFLKADGSILASNSLGAWELRADGFIDLNGVTIDPSGKVTIPNSLNLAGKEVAGHGHPQGNDSAGDSQVDTGPNQ